VLAVLLAGADAVGGVDAEVEALAPGLGAVEAAVLDPADAAVDGLDVDAPPPLHATASMAVARTANRVSFKSANLLGRAVTWIWMLL
jgi:hypothetical protein